LVGLSREMAGLKSEVARLGEADSALAGRIESAESAISALRGDIDALAPGAGNAEELIARIEALEQRPAGESGTAINGSEIEALVGEISAARDAVRTALEAANTNAGAVATLRDEIAALSSRIQAETARPEVALAIAAVALKSAMDSGAPFTLQLE